MNLIKYFVFIFFLSFTLNSCMSEVDFNQASELEFSPEFDISLVYFKLYNNDFVDQNTNTEIPLRLDFTNVDVFENASSSNSLEKAVLKFEIENTFNKSFDIDFLLMDDNNNILLSIPFNVNQNENKSLNTTYLKGTQEFEQLIKTTKITVIGSMEQNSNITTDDMYIHFKSAVDLFLKIKDV